MTRVEKILMILFFLKTLSSENVVYYTNDGTLTSFPHDIPADVQIIVIHETQITEIDYIEPFPNLTMMFIGRNALTEFPDLSNVSSSLERLFCSNNNISVVNFIPPMNVLNVLALANNRLTHLPDLTNVSRSLEELYLEENHIHVVDGIVRMSVLRLVNLAGNDLTEFPDLRNAGSTLEELFLQYNNITSYPEELLRPLLALRILHLGDEFVTLPNVCAMGSKRMPLTIQLYSNKMTCDINAAYAKLALEAGRLEMELAVWISSLVCVGPEHLAGRLFSDVNITELLCASDVTYRRLENLTDWACLLQTSVVYKEHRIDCAVDCARRKDCLMFSTDNDSCILTETGRLSTSNDTLLARQYYFRV